MSTHHVSEAAPETGSLAAVAAPDEFLRSVLAASGDCIKVLDLDGKLLYMTEGAERLMDVSDFNAIRGCPWPDFWSDGLNDEAVQAIAAARKGGEGRFQGMALTFKGVPKWWDVRVTPIRDHLDVPQRLLVVSREITEQKNAQERQHLLMQEMAHRVKNALAVVQSIATLSLRDGDDMGPAREVFLARLLALAHAQDMMLKSALDAQVDVRSLLANIIAIHGDAHQFVIEGQDVSFGPKFALAFSMVVHELYTNAVKYGALTQPTGRVNIAWKLGGFGQSPAFELTWIESGGPHVVAPKHLGFGSRMIERSLVRLGSTSVNVDYAPAGMRFQLTASSRDSLED
jgi:PAS domain S-box-containing protein